MTVTEFLKVIWSAYPMDKVVDFADKKYVCGD